MQRPDGCHYQRPNKSAAVPGAVIVLDCETETCEPVDPHFTYAERLRLGIAQFGRIENGQWTRHQEIKFTSGPKLWAWIAERLDRVRTTWLFAHGLGFDLRISGFFDALDAGLISISASGARPPHCESGPQKRRSPIICPKCPPCIFRVYGQHDETLVAVDTLNYFKCDLRTIGDSLALPKLDMPTDDDTDEAWWTYCRRDVDILRECVLDLIRTVRSHDWGMLRYTAAGQSAALYRHAHTLPLNRIVFHPIVEVRKLERAALTGGETECYWLGKREGPIHELDANNLYGSILHDCKIPFRLVGFDRVPDSQKTLPPQIPLDRSIAEVTLFSPIRTFPVRLHGRSLYCRGRFRTTLAGPELVAAYDAGCITDWHAWAIYDTAVLGRTFAEQLWAERDRFNSLGKKHLAIMVKSMLVGWWGRMSYKLSGFRPVEPHSGRERWERWAECRPGPEFDWFQNIAGVTHAEPEDWTEPEESFPAIGAFVTAYGRERMRSLRTAAGFGNVLAQIVDSVFVTAAGRRQLEKSGALHPSLPGHLREVAIHDGIDLAGINVYKINGQWIAQGIKTNSTEISPDVFQTDQWQSLRAMIATPRPGQHHHAPEPLQHIKRVNKEVKPEYRRGHVSPVGWIVPFTLPDDYELISRMEVPQSVRRQHVQ